MSRTLILLLFASTLSHAQTKFYTFMGGGSEPAGPTTIFDDEVNNVGRFMKSNGWTGSVAYNGGHSRTEELISSTFGQNRPFTKAEYEAQLTQIENNIKNGTIKQGDQVLLYIATHGAQKSPAEKTHQVATAAGVSSDLNTLKGAENVTLDRVQTIIDLAEAKGIKLGVIDSSCHSGSTLNLKSEKSCIISSTGPNHFGYNTWGANFSANMKKGKNLEEVFLQTFKGRYETSFPMISTPVGRELQNTLYPKIGRYLFSYDENPLHDKLASYLENSTDGSSCFLAEVADNNLKSFLQEVQKVLLKNQSDVKKLDSAVARYKAFQDQMKKDLMAYGNQKARTTEQKVCADWLVQFKGYPDRKDQNCTTWKHREILSIDFDDEIKRYQERVSKETGNNATWCLSQIEVYKKGKELKEQLIKENPGYENLVNYFKTVPDLERRSWNMAMDVSRELQNIYTLLYKQNSAKTSASNPCRDFVL